jgi:ferredoxin-type protein NapH
MLKITPYIPIIVPIVIIGGLFNPLFGYFLLLDMIVLMVISPFKGRFFCGNLCSRGLFNDFVLSKISRKGKVPKLFKSMTFRIIVLVIMMSRMIYQIIQSQGILYKLGAVLLATYIMQTIIISIIAVTISPRAWCHFCPAGTIQRLFDRKKYVLKADKSKCIHCGLCNRICPMGIPVKDILNHPDCIKCGRCIEVCPKKVLKF